MALASSSTFFLASECGGGVAGGASGGAALRIRASSSSDGGLRRPAAPAARPPPTPQESPPIPSPSTAAQSISPAPAAAAAAATAAGRSSALFTGVTIEFQRQRAKELQEYFLDRKFEEETRKGRIFGWTSKNEVGNGRWAMFGFAVGLLTEYATGSDFIDQLKIIASNLGIADFD